jgi:hypothetical protein
MIEGVIRRLRSTYLNNRGFLIWMIVLTVVLSAGTIAMDVFLPRGWFLSNYVRALAAIITAVPMFSAGYLLAFKQHEGLVEKSRSNEDDGEYIELRLRYSYRVRVQQSIIVGSVLALLGIITSYTKVYTLAAAIIVSAGFGLIVYCRLTDDERTLKKYSVPDPRDVMDERDDAIAELEREAREDAKKKIRENDKGSDEDDSEDKDKKSVFKL